MLTLTRAKFISTEGILRIQTELSSMYHTNVLAFDALAMRNHVYHKIKHKTHDVIYKCTLVHCNQTKEFKIRINYGK